MMIDEDEYPYIEEIAKNNWANLFSQLLIGLTEAKMIRTTIPPRSRRPCQELAPNPAQAHGTSAAPLRRLRKRGKSVGSGLCACANAESAGVSAGLRIVAAVADEEDQNVQEVQTEYIIY